MDTQNKVEMKLENTTPPPREDVLRLAIALMSIVQTSEKYGSQSPIHFTLDHMLATLMWALGFKHENNPVQIIAEATLACEEAARNGDTTNVSSNLEKQVKALVCWTMGIEPESLNNPLSEAMLKPMLDMTAKAMVAGKKADTTGDMKDHEAAVKAATDGIIACDTAEVLAMNAMAQQAVSYE